MTNKSPHTTINSLICIPHNSWKHSDKQQCLMKCLFLYKTRTFIFCSFETYFSVCSSLNCFVFLHFSTQWALQLFRLDVRTAVCVRTLIRSITACGATQQNPASTETCAPRSWSSVSSKITDVRTILLVFLFSILSLNIILNFAKAKLKIHPRISHWRDVSDY